MKSQLSLGPVFFNWSPEELRDFYFRIADEAPIDTVYVGEVVCAKRSVLTMRHRDSIIQRLRQGGKRVVLSSQALIDNEHEAAAMRDLASTNDLGVEINDIGLIPILSGREYHLGPFLNIYNGPTLEVLACQGAQRVCLPPELPATSIASIAASAKIDVEVFVFGRLPLAISARCFHARAHHLHKDGCMFVCDNDPNGLVVKTLEGEPFLAINGTQTLSYTCANLVGDLELLAECGVRHFRLSPMAIDMVSAAHMFRDVLDGKMDAAVATAELAVIASDFDFSNGFLHGVEGRHFHRTIHASGPEIEAAW